MRSLFLVFLLFPPVLHAKDKPEPVWEKIENCTLADGYRDGDSFLVRVAPKTFRVLRLYFVDTCEDSADQRYPERIADQAAYFGISMAQTSKLGDEAAKFSERVMGKPFRVWLAGQKAPGQSKRQRFYAMIETQDGKFLSSLLIENGLARIKGKRITLPDGRTSREYLAELARLESKAKTANLGGWNTLPTVKKS